MNAVETPLPGTFRLMNSLTHADLQNKARVGGFTRDNISPYKDEITHWEEHRAMPMKL